MQRSLLLLTVIMNLLFSTIPVYAHPGRTDAYGCHSCKTNCTKWGLNTGEYHCHNAKALPQPEEPVKNHFSETGGYTVPAPEYKKQIETQKPQVQEIKPKVEKVESKTLQKELIIPKQNLKKENQQTQEESWLKKFFQFLLKFEI